MGEGLSLIDEGGSHLRPRNLFPETNAERVSILKSISLWCGVWITGAV